VRNHTRSAALAAAILLFPAYSGAQSVVPPAPGTEHPVKSDTLLARLTAEAIAANPGLQARKASADAALQRVRPAGALPDPMLSAGVMNLTLPRFAFRESDFTEVDFELSQEFPWPGSLGARTRVARAEARVRSAHVAVRRREIVVRTAELYYRLRYIVTARATLKRQRELLTAAVEIATTRYATAAAPQSDPLQARVALARLDAEDADLAQEQVKTGAGLKALRGVRGSDRLTIEFIRPQTVLLALEGGHPDALVSPDSLPAHPRLSARRAAFDAAKRRVRVEQLGGRPDFSITTRYGARPLGADFFSAFVGLRVPLWAGRKQGRLADAARADAEAARAELAEETVTLEAEREAVRAGVATGAARLRLLITQVIPSGRATVEAVLRGYRVGQVPFLNVIAAEDSLYRAELEAVMVAADHLTHLVMLQELLEGEDTP
jgi:cobalt-zinc-cadmium efflux system outer membrane protein